jgi:hypothetical protein
MRFSTILLLGLPLLVACSDVKDDEDDHDHDHDHGLITAIVLDFESDSGETMSARWEDPTGDGSGVTVDDIMLTAGASYDVSVEVLNQLEEPVEDVTLEILELADEHQFFFTGAGVTGPGSDSGSAVVEHSYNDTDNQGLPLGVDNIFNALEAGSGDMEVTLRHMPPESGEPIKYDGMAGTVAADGFSAIGGSNDIQVTFNVQVN